MPIICLFRRTGFSAKIGSVVQIYSGTRHVNPDVAKSSFFAHGHVILQNLKGCPFLSSPRNGDDVGRGTRQTDGNVKWRGNMTQVMASLSAREWTPILLAIGISLIPLVPYVFGG
jgi:hypothetical protein